MTTSMRCNAKNGNVVYQAPKIQLTLKFLIQSDRKADTDIKLKHETQKMIVMFKLGKQVRDLELGLGPFIGKVIND